MTECRIRTLPVGSLRTNCYIVYDAISKNGFVIDPGGDSMRIQQALTGLMVTPQAILLTHGHFDHMLAAEQLRTTYEIPVYAYTSEKEVAGNPSLNLSAAFGGSMALQVDRTIEDGQQLDLAGFDIQVMHTPGHTSGSVCYYIENQQVLFSGDTLFAQSVGRVDFPTGSQSALIRSIQQRLFVLPDDTQVYPGHEASTSIGYEKQYNPVAAFGRNIG